MTTRILEFGGLAAALTVVTTRRYSIRKPQS
jgi:hypothetical protein